MLMHALSFVFNNRRIRPSDIQDGHYFGMYAYRVFHTRSMAVQKNRFIFCSLCNFIVGYDITLVGIILLLF